MASSELDFLVQMLRSQPPVAGADVGERRAGLERLTAAPLPADVSSEAVTADGVPAEWVVADGADPGRAVLYLHGGGYVIGSIATHRDLAARLSRATGARTLLVGYRLAPEDPHPAAVEDAVRAYRWLVARGVDPRRVAIAGDSAGGGLTVATLVALREAGDALPAAGVCLSPWTDLACEGGSMDTHDHLDPMVRPDGLREMAAMYLGGLPAETPLASPVHADLRGLPPLLVQVGTAEVLLDDATRLAERARAAGVDVTLEVWDDMVHVWQAFAAILPEARDAIERIGAFVRART
ncbi:MAG: alpha/beta hydrolase [Alphaproteobacteria bacterium]